MARKSHIDPHERHIGAANTVHTTRGRVPASTARRRKEIVPERLREYHRIWAKMDRGEPLTWREKNVVTWASPQKSAEQRRKTGNNFVPRDEVIGRERQHGRGRRSGWRPPRTGVKQTFTGRPKVERGNSREMLIPSKTNPDTLELRLEKRVRRSFDWFGKPKPKAKAKAAPKPARITHAQRILWTNDQLRAHARSIGAQIPPRAQRRGLLEAIDRAEMTPGYGY
jgi:hypothetical protein